MRLIDADKLRADVLSWENCYSGFSDTYDKARIIDAINEQPTIDPVLRDKENGITYAPVKRGRWIDTGSGQECSVCHEIQYGYDNYRYFCPNCGAQMESKEEEL